MAALARAVAAVAGALFACSAHRLALLASAHRHALTAEVEFYGLSLRKNCADACAGCNDCLTVGLVFPARFFAAVLCTQTELPHSDCPLSSIARKT